MGVSNRCSRRLPPLARRQTGLNSSFRRTDIHSVKSNRNITVIIICVFASFILPAAAQFSGLSGFSEAFLRDYTSAQTMVNQSKSAEPLIALQRRYTNATEQAELELSIGLAYNQRTGVVDPSKAVVHLTAALQHELPEKTYLQILLRRGTRPQQHHKHQPGPTGN